MKYKTIEINLTTAMLNKPDHYLNSMAKEGWKVKQVLHYDNAKTTILMEKRIKKWWQFSI